MNDKGKIIIGLAIALTILTFPAWYAQVAGDPGPRPMPEVPQGRCVESRQYMTAHHMDVLDQWRNAVVREGRKEYTSKKYGDKHEMSLTRTCMSASCHNSRQAFCTRCHDYANVRPNCFNCHVEPQVNAKVK